METLYFEHKAPTGEVLVDLREYGIDFLKWVPFVTNINFAEKHGCGKVVEHYQNDPDNEDKILLVVHDTSDPINYPYRYFIRVATVHELRTAADIY